MFKKKLLSATAFAVLFGGVVADSHACSRISWDTEKGVFVSRTFDWIESSHAALENFPKGFEYTRSLRADALVEQAKYAVTAITSYGALVGEGVNEAGLSGNVLFFNEMDIKDIQSSESLGHAKLMQHLLSQYATVADAINAMENMDMMTDEIPGMPTTMTVHFSLQDTTGDAAIIQWQEKELKIWHGPEHNILTNSPEYQVHLANLAESSQDWGPIEEQDSEVDLKTNGNLHSQDRFISNSYFYNHLKEPSSVANGLLKLESVIYKVPHDAPNRPINGQMTGYGTEWMVTQNITTGDAVLRYTWNDSFNVMTYNVKDIQASGERLKLDVTQPGLFGDITHLILTEGKI
ncbi:linear amide C-N hydrolase [Thaumasiovibrio sp. DFM-14]|uniref:linear amide C-N hydrolase n=1 Tax=Thaumasiovibrio sp. DFM-14 TaxID=3384792 RepID=UPI0039A11302